MRGLRFSFGSRTDMGVSPHSEAARAGAKFGAGMRSTRGETVFHEHAFGRSSITNQNENRKHEDSEQQEPNGCSHGNCNCLGGLASDDRRRAVRPPHHPAKSMSEETWMQAIVPADRAWAVFANLETGYSQKEPVVCWSRLDVVGLVRRKYGLVRADSRPGFVSYLDEVKPTEITPTRSEEPHHRRNQSAVQPHNNLLLKVSLNVAHSGGLALENRRKQLSRATLD